MPPVEAPIPGGFFDRDDLSLSGVIAYRQYLAMNKGLVTGQRVDELVGIHQRLVGDTNAVHQAAAGWAAVEGAIMSRGRQSERIGLFEEGVAAWIRSRDRQVEDPTNPYVKFTNVSEPLRTQRAIIMAPLLEAIIRRQVTDGVVSEVFEATVGVAQESRELEDKAKANALSNDERDYAGFNSELLIQLLYNIRKRITTTAIPAPLRADDGNYNRQATHDLLLIKHGAHGVFEAMPTEVKGKLRPEYKQRYKALLISTRSKDHVAVPGTSMADRLEAVIAVHRDGEDGTGLATRQQKSIVKTMDHNLESLQRSYTKTRRLRWLSPQGSVTVFHDHFRRG